MGSEADNEIPDTGAVFTFGASGFADNLPSHFFIRNDPIIDLACGEEHTMVICQNGRLFGFGGNEYGQVGLGHKNSVVKPSCVKSLKPEKVKLIACGQHHTIACTESDKLYGWGNNSNEQLGLGENEDSEDKVLPTRCDEGIVFKSPIKQLAAGSMHSVALTSDGKVYIWGSNQEGQLGVGDGVKKARSPYLLPLKDNIISIACGLYHTLLLSDQGQIFVFGEGDSGKLGLGGNNSVPFPIPLSVEDLSSKVIGISAGGDYSMAVSEDGRVYAWGDNEQEQLGFPREEYTQVHRPTFVSSLSKVKVKYVICGYHHTAFITDKNELYTCGETHHGKLCSDGELEVDSPKIRCTLPFKVSRFKGFSVEKVACGGKQTMILAMPEKYTNNIITNGFSEHVDISSVDHHNSKNGSTTNLDVPADRDIISPPPAKTTPLPQTVHISEDTDGVAEKQNDGAAEQETDGTTEQQNDRTSNPSSESLSPPPENKSSLNPSLNNILSHDQTDENNTNRKTNEPNKQMEVVDVVTDDSLSSVSKTDESVSTKHRKKCAGYNNDVVVSNYRCENYAFRGESPVKINRLENNYFKQTTAPKVIVKDKQLHHTFGYSVNPNYITEEDNDRDSLKYYYDHRNKTINEGNDDDDDDDVIDVFNDFDEDSDEEDEDSGRNNFQNNNIIDSNTYCCSNSNRGTIYDSCVRNKYNENDKYRNYRRNNFEDVDAIEEMNEGNIDNDYMQEHSVTFNNPNCKYEHSNFTNDQNNFILKELHSSIKYLFKDESHLGVVPRIICFYEQSEPFSSYPQECKKHNNMRWFKDNKLREVQDEKNKQEVVEHWLEDNKFKEKRRNKREKRIKIKCDKSCRRSRKLREKSNKDCLNTGFLKGGGNDRTGGGVFQNHGPFFNLKSFTRRRNKSDGEANVSSEANVNINSAESTNKSHENQSSSPKEVKSDNVLTRIFGNKRVTKNNHSGSLEIEQNGSSSGAQNIGSSENNKDGDVSPDKHRNHHTSTNRTTRGYQKNSRMCVIL